MSPERPKKTRVIERVKAPVESLFNAFIERRVASETKELFEVLDNRGISSEVREYLFGVATEVYKHHLGEKRVTGGPYARHPFAVAKAVAENPFVIIEELRDHEAIALGHDLPENTDITPIELVRQMQHAGVVKGIRLLSRYIRSEGGIKQDRRENFKRILESGDIKVMRVKIADWGNNLETTPKTTDGYRGKKKNKVLNFQKKFSQTSEFILPLIRSLPGEEEQVYQYERLKTVFNQHKPEGAPDLEPLHIAA